MSNEIQEAVKYLHETFNTKKVSDLREIGVIYYDEKDKVYRGYVLGVNGSVDITWDRYTGKSNLTPNSDLICKSETLLEEKIEIPGAELESKQERQVQKRKR